MSGSVTIPRKASRWMLVTAPVLALFGSVAAPAQAGDYYGGYRYDDAPRYSGYSYGYHPRCWRCGSSARRGTVLERRYKYVERDYYERRYTAPVHHHHYGYGYGWNAPRSYYPGYRTGEAAFPWGYGGVRQHPYGWYRRRPSYDGYGSSAYDDVERPPAPVGEDGPYGDE
jgi:hypothetical protein